MGASSFLWSWAALPRQQWWRWESWHRPPPLVVSTSSPSLLTGPPSSPSLPTGEACADSSPTGPAADTQHEGTAKKLLKKYKDVVGANKKLPPVKSAVEHLIETTAARPVSSLSGWLPLRWSLWPWSPKCKILTYVRTL